MLVISAKDVGELRERSGAGMMDCKKALIENNGDMEAAIDWLRTKGLATAAKKAGRIAAEGLIGVLTDGLKGALVEVNSETDFVSRNEQFQQFVTFATQVALGVSGDIEALKGARYPNNDHTVEHELTSIIGVIGENMNLRRSACISVTQGIVASYLHAATTANLGRIGVLVALESEADADKLHPVARMIAMHIAAANPRACHISDLDTPTLERERAIYGEQARESGKPAEFIEKMIEGRMRKFYEECVLSEQVFLIDDSKRTIKQVILDLAHDVGKPVLLKGFIQFRLGEGIEKKEEDFAAEVNRTAQMSN